MAEKRAKTHIEIRGACANNLKKLDISIDRDALVVITGVSGSGKTSLLFDTLYAEGRRRYVESLSTYVRQFLGRLQKPPVTQITGISPAIALEQKTASKNPHATVGTTTEIYDHFKLLYARLGRTYSPISGEEVRKDTPQDVSDYIQSLPDRTKLCIIAPVEEALRQRTWEEILRVLLSQGYTRVLLEEKIHPIEALLDSPPPSTAQLNTLGIIIDRITPASSDPHHTTRVMDSIQTAFNQGNGLCMVYDVDSGSSRPFSNTFSCDGEVFQVPSVGLFSFTSPRGACEKCVGYGVVLGVDEQLVIPNPKLSLSAGAIVPFMHASLRVWQRALLAVPDLDTDKPYAALSVAERRVVWEGKGTYRGVKALFADLDRKKQKIQHRVLLSRYRSKITCPDCEGGRLCKASSYVRFQEKPITYWMRLSLYNLLDQVQGWKLTKSEASVARIAFEEITSRLTYLIQVGLGYLSLDRLSSTLSGGEFQRLQLATTLGRPLQGAMYLLDEPSVGLHPKDVSRLLEVIKGLRQTGSPVLVIEHEELIIREADQLIDIGPAAGTQGGKLVFQGTLSSIDQAKNSLTADYLLGRKKIQVPKKVTAPTGWLSLSGITCHNLYDVSIKIPLGVATCITGVSGSGKSTLVHNVVYPTLHYALCQELPAQLTHARQAVIEGDISQIEGVESIGKRSIGRSSRANPITYIKAYDIIRSLFAKQLEAKKQGFTAGDFSFNRKGGRCEHCEGEGQVTVEMQFMADVHFTCEHCQGKRFVAEILQVTYQDKNISDVLGMTARDAVAFFAQEEALAARLSILEQVGLGYMCLGQPLSTLSGGEAQRIKIASFLSNKVAQLPKVLIFDEPTTGLHFHDVEVLLRAMYALRAQGHTLLIVEHNIELIKCMDYVIDLGPEGGDKGGKVCFQGLPSELAEQPDNHTATHLKTAFEHVK